MPNKQNTKPYDCVVVLGKNWEEYPGSGTAAADKKVGRIKLSVESKITALAAGEMYVSGVVKKILFSTGHTAGSDFPSEAAEMKRFMKERFPRIPGENIILEEKSFDTPSNAKEVKKIIKKYGFKKLALLTTKAHMLRADKLFKNFGIKVDDFYSEEEAKKISSHYRKFIEGYSKSPRIKIEELKELLLRQFIILDPKGKFLEKVTRRIRHQPLSAAWSVNEQEKLNPIFVVFV